MLSIARRLGIHTAGLVPASRYVEGIVEMLLDATQHQLFSDHRIMHNPRLLTGDFYFTKLLTLPSCHRSDLEK